MESLRFKDHLTARPKPSGLDVVCTYHHFAIITYAVDAVRLANLVPRRFRLLTVPVEGREKGFLSVVALQGSDFTSAVYPFPRFSMGQVNYRTYIIDQVTGESGIWFLGSVLDSWTSTIPRFLWKLPWHSGRISFSCNYDQLGGVYRNYAMTAESVWAPASLSLVQNSDEVFSFPGFPDEETALVCFTHPLAGFYRRLDDKLGLVRVWHERLLVRPARLEAAQFNLLSRLKLVSPDRQLLPHSVLVDHRNEFTIYLPPEVLE